MTVQDRVGRAESLNIRKQEEDLEEAPSKQRVMNAHTVLESTVTLNEIQINTLFLWFPICYIFQKRGITCIPMIQCHSQEQLMRK